jgi:UDP-arabinose 4-epimerase
MTEKSRPSVLITGGAGYVGSHTCKLLALSGYLPIAYDNLSLGHRSAVRWGPLVTGDIADADLLRRTIDSYRITSVIHFAGSAYVGESVENPRKYFENNLSKTITMLGSLLDSGVRNFVLSSTCATYGPPKYLPIDERHPREPINPYGESKHAIEKILDRYGEAHGLRWLALRYFNAAGADPDGELGECHEEETHLIPLAIRSTLSAECALNVFGADYPTKDGTAVRDYIHVADLARAHVAALEYLDSEKPSCAFNLGSGVGHSVREVIATVEKITGKRTHIKELPRRVGDPSELIADSSLARRELNWEPRFSDLENIIETAWRWSKKDATVESCAVGTRS